MPIPYPSVICRLAIAAVLFVVIPGATNAATPRVPDGFKIRLVAAVPAVQYPCQVATAPDGSLFVGEDPMDQIGPANKPIDRILLFREGKEPVVFADKLNAIFGMVWHDGALYVMNMPHLTVFRDRDGDGRADERKEIFKDLGVPAGFPNDFNDHIVSGLKIGLDGYLYISVGDKGVPKATGPDGRTAQVVGGGTLRCRLDGTGLEVYSTGTRNHLEPNLDDRDNLFTYDNTDDGLGWWTRVTHHVDGGYYGYPYDYHKRTDRMLPRMAEYGGGSPCGGVFYGEDAWPEEYRGRLFWAEWGKRSVRAFRIVPDGASFKVADVIDFVRPGDVETFRPLDLALSPEGRTLYVADWSFGSWNNKTEKLGRVYAITYEGSAAIKTRPRGKDSDPIEAQIKQLDHPSYHERRRAQTALIRQGRAALGPVVAALANSATDPVAKRHLVWVLDAIVGGTPEATEPLIEALRSPVADVRAQAARALGERAAPIAEDALIALLEDREPAARLQATIALGRIGDHNAVPALLPVLADKDAFVAFSSRRALRRIGDWRAVARGLDSPEPKVREGVLLAMEQVYDAEALRQLTRFAESAERPIDERAKAVRFLGEVHRKAPPWNGKWWGTQPAKNEPPARTIAWEGTPRVLAAARGLLRDPATRIRIAAVGALAEARDQESRATIRSRFDGEKDAEVRRAIALALGKLEDRESLDLLIAAFRDPRTPDPVRDASLEAVEMIGTDKAVKALGELLTRKSLPADTQPRVIAALGRFEDPAAVPPLLGTLKAPQPAVRSAAVDALVAIVDAKVPTGRRRRQRASDRGRASAHAEVSRAVRGLLADPDVSVRHRAIAAAAALKDREAIPTLLAAAESTDSRFEAALALAALPDIRALQVYLRGLVDKSTDLRKASADAIANIRDKAAPVLDQLARRDQRPPALLPELRSIYAALAPITAWRVVGPFPIAADPGIAGKSVDPSASYEGSGGRRVSWKTVEPADKRGQVDLGRTYSHDDDLAAYGYAEIESPSDRTAQMAVGSDDTLTVWLNGKEIYRFSDSRGFEHEQARFDVSLRKGINRVLIRCGNRGGPWLFAAAVTAPADFAFLKGPSVEAFNLEAYRAAALKGGGDPARGRRFFADLKGLACIKCHTVGMEGGNVGPELGSVGAKYPRDELIASVLNPSAKISSGYEPVALALSDGRIVTGIVRNETADAVEIQDADAKLVKVAKDDIDARKQSDVSLMPTGLAQGLSPRDFADLIAYLESLRNAEVNKK
jgi:putative membrane-bound dehydrogenase-like protein